MAKNELDIAFEEFESECGGSAAIRAEMINSLRQQVARGVAEIHEGDKPMMIQAKLMIFKTLDDITKSKEDVTLKKLKMKLARKNSETNGMVGTAVVELMKQIRADRADSTRKVTEGDLAQASDDIAKREKELLESGDPELVKAITVSDGETIECGTVPTSDGPAPDLDKLNAEEDDE